MLHLSQHQEFSTLHEETIVSTPINVAILDDHQSIVDGYLFRLQSDTSIQVVATAGLGEALESMLANHPVDVLLLDVSVPLYASSTESFPILHEIPRLLDRYPNLHILVISMHNQRPLIKAVMEAGASGYILKDDRETIQNLAKVVGTVATGSIHLSKQAMQQFLKDVPDGDVLSVRQREVLSVCAAYPNESTAELAERMCIANSTVRNLLSKSYMKLNVQSRAAALAKAQQLGLLPPLDQAVVIDA